MHKIKLDINSLSKKYDIPSAVMGKINKMEQQDRLDRDGIGMIQLMKEIYTELRQ